MYLNIKEDDSVLPAILLDSDTWSSNPRLLSAGKVFFSNNKGNKEVKDVNHLNELLMDGIGYITLKDPDTYFYSIHQVCRNKLHDINQEGSLIRTLIEIHNQPADMSNKETVLNGDTYFMVIDGNFTFQIGNEYMELSQGQGMWVPKDSSVIYYNESYGVIFKMQSTNYLLAD